MISIRLFGFPPSIPVVAGVAQVGKTVRLLNWIYATGMFLFLPLVIVIARQFFLFVL